MRIVIGMALGFLALVLTVGAFVPSAHSTAPPTTDTVGLSLASSGALSVVSNFTDPNGSALRYAMDGNFTPLVNALPLNTTSRAQLLEGIAALELTSPGLFGDHSGIVSSEEVEKFVALLEEGLGRLGGQSVPNVVNVTLDGQAPGSKYVDEIAFGNAEGPVTSTEPVYVTTGVVENFTLSSGGSHLLKLAIPSTVTALPILPLPAGSVTVQFNAPSGTTITQVSGLANVNTTADVWGWTSPSSTGDYAAGSTTPISFAFENAFPWGNLLVIGVPVAVALAAVVLFVRHRRRRSRAGAGDEVGSSGSE